MNSLEGVINIIEQLKLNPEKHDLTPEQIDGLNLAIKELQKSSQKDKVKDAVEIGANIATAVQILYQILTNSS